MNTVRVLIIDDNSADRQALARTLGRTNVPVVVAEASTATEGIAHIAAGGCNCVLLDFHLPGMNGLDLLEELRRRDLSVPVIAVTAHGNERQAVELMRAGAAEYLSKTGLTPERLERSLRHALAVGDLIRLKAQLQEREQRARRDAEAENAAKDQFLATLSHELRTPLSVILGWARLLTSDSFDDQSARARAYEAIEHNASALARHIDDLLDVSRIVSGTLSVAPTPIDIRSAFCAALDSLRPAAAARSIDLAYTQHGAERLVAADPARLNQILMNLVSNAIKFTPEGGRVDVRVEFTPQAVQIEVHDTGIGIDPDFLPHVFSRFKQADPSASRRHGGLGIGLSIVQQLTELHGGTVAAHSEGLDRGATFTVTLPDRRPPVPTGQARPRPDSRRLRGVRVLMVDDDPDARELVTILLELEGANVGAAASAVAARAALEQGSYDVLISDISMPEQDGYSLVEGLRALERAGGSRRLPAAALTALARPIDRERAMSAGFDEYLAKPVEADALIATVAALAARGPHVSAGGLNGSDAGPNVGRGQATE